MKKFYSLTAALMLAVGFINAQCTIDPNNTIDFNPAPGNVPPAQVGVPYDQTLQFHIPVSKPLTIAGFSVTAYIDSVVLNDVTGLPTGLTWSKSPASNTFLPDSNGCGRTQGTTTAAAANYPIIFDGRVYFHVDTTLNLPIIGNYHIDTSTSFTIQQYLQAQYNATYSIDVQDPNGIKDFNADLNSIVSVFPNPSTGTFTFNLKAGDRVNGQIIVTDVTGKQVFTQNLDVVGIYSTMIDLSNKAKGLYTVQLRTANGFASKNISIE